ncbi:MAG: hypothetical protein AB8F94_01180 [Saprospiraceae bacterium]
MKKTTKENIEDLGKLGYFKYSSPEDINDLKTELERCIREHKELHTIYSEEPEKEFIAKDFRYINCDHEELIESHAEDTLEYLSFSFDKMNLPFSWKSIKKGFDEEKDLAYNKIQINGKSYILYQTGWSQYAYDFVKIINDQLEILNSKERLYLLAGGNDGDLILLDNKLKEYFDEHIELREAWKPRRPEIWIEKNKNE